jgi:hypothetical protein
MDDSEIQHLINELDAAVTKDDAKLLIHWAGHQKYDGELYELVANRKGYLRAGVELLKAALVPLDPRDIFTPINIDYLIVPGSVGIKRITRQEDVEAALPPPRESSWKNTIAGVGCLAVMVFFALCAIVGLYHVIGWL